MTCQLEILENDMDDLYINFTASITRLNKIIQKIKSIEVKEYGLQPIHVSCWYYLSKNPQGLTAKELCELSISDKAAISRALKTLQAKGYITYEPRGRNEVVKITDKGNELAEVISSKINSAVKAGSAKLTDEERRFFYNSLLEISDNLVNYYKKLLNKEV